MTGSHQDEVFDRLVEAAPTGNLPIVTFSESVRFHLDGEEVHAFHVAPAHTDGDSFVHLRRANVLHMGDVFFNGLYPFIDVSGGGSVRGVIENCDRALALCDENTKIVPGHGPIAGRAELIVYRDMLTDLRAKVVAGLDAGKSLEALQAERPSAAYDERWGQAWLKADQIVKIVYLSEQKERAGRR
jgi:glyoxylase-like metal-dependent hydrolase (beta-lactamase superfamily II)